MYNACIMINYFICTMNVSHTKFVFDDRVDAVKSVADVDCNYTATSFSSVCTVNSIHRYAYHYDIYVSTWMCFCTCNDYILFACKTYFRYAIMQLVLFCNRPLNVY